MKLSVWKVRLAACAFMMLIVTDGIAGEVQGVLQWEHRTNLSLPVSGVVKEVLVSEGQTVKQGKVMLRLDMRRVKARIQAAEARMSRHKPGRDEARRELERAKELFDRTVLSQVELDKAKNDYAEKNAALQEARAEVIEEKLNLEYSELKAPFDLVVLNVHAVKGQAVVNQFQAVPLIEVAENRLAAVAFTVPAKLAGIKPGAAVSVIYTDQQLAGKISVIDYDTNKHHSVLRVTLKDQSALKGVAGYPIRITWR